MATLLGPDGLPVRSTRPTNQDALGYDGWFSTPLSSNRWTDRSDAETGHLVSFERIYRSQPVLYGVVNKLARRVATLPFAPFKLVEENLSREQVLTGQLYDLLRRPWPGATSLDLNHHIMLSLLVHGNALVGMMRANGPQSPPTGLWPLDWSQVSAFGKQGQPVEWWTTTQFGTDEIWIRAEDVMHFSWSAPDGMQIGVSPLEALGVTLALEDAAQRHSTALFRNGSRPSLAVSVDQDNPRREFLDFARERVEAMHKGVDNAGRTFFMGANVKVQPLSLTPVEAELVQQRRLNADEVGMVYDLSGPLRGDLSHGTMANVEEMLKSMYRDVVPPWTELIVQTYQAQMLDPYEEWRDLVVRFDFGDKLKGEPQEQAARLSTLVSSGLMTRNEARRELGLPPDSDPNADKLTVPANNQSTLGAMDQVATQTQRNALQQENNVPDRISQNRQRTTGGIS